MPTPTNHSNRRSPGTSPARAVAVVCGWSLFLDPIACQGDLIKTVSAPTSAPLVCLDAFRGLGHFVTLRSNTLHALKVCGGTHNVLPIERQ